MLNRKDPLIESVQKVMKENETRRAIEKSLNEELGIESVNALPHEYREKYQNTLAERITEDLHPNQKKLDMNKNKKLDAQDFAILRSKKKPVKEYGVDTEREMAAKKKGMYEEKKEKVEDMSAGEVISDFVHSKNPKFAGKSTKERQKMALGAYYSKHPEKSKKRMDEGFNIRHNSSVNASAEKQVVAEQYVEPFSIPSSADTSGETPSTLKKKIKDFGSDLTDPKNVEATIQGLKTIGKGFVSGATFGAIDPATEKEKQTPDYEVGQGLSVAAPVPLGPVPKVLKFIGKTARELVSAAPKAKTVAGNIEKAVTKSSVVPNVVRPSTSSSDWANRLAAIRRGETAVKKPPVAGALDDYKPRPSAIKRPSIAAGVGAAAGAGAVGLSTVGSQQSNSRQAGVGTPPKPGVGSVSDRLAKDSTGSRQARVGTPPKADANQTWSQKVGAAMLKHVKSGGKAGDTITVDGKQIKVAWKDKAYQSRLQQKYGKKQ